MASDHEDGEHVEAGAVTNGPLDLPTTQKKKKTKKRKPASKRGLGAPTGMETFYADAPITPAEFAEHQKLYHPDFPFLDRVLTAIERFEQTRRLTPERRDIFYKWLHYGGIKVGTNPFSSGHDEEGMDKGDIATIKSKVRIPDAERKLLETADTDDPTYVVDFLGCTQAFFSYRVSAIYYLVERTDVELITTTIERFMDYLMQHDVCPEYTKDILTTRNFCRDATNELWSTRQAQLRLPGDYNIACSTLFGGNYGRMYDGKTYWGELQPGESAFVGFTPEQATQIVGYGIAGAADEHVYSKYAEAIDKGDGEDLDTVKIVTDAGFEIMDIQFPTADCKDMYKRNTNEYRPVGRVIARAWKIPYSAPEDLTSEERMALQTKSSSPGEVYVFFMEEIIQQYLSVGQKVIATIRQLNCGAWFFDEFSNIYPNYELWTANDLVEDYKEPRMIPGAYVHGEEFKD